MEARGLSQLFWNVTYACNYRCGICFTDASQRRADELTTDEAFDLVDHAAAAGVRDIIIAGGEPFMREDLVLVLAHMAELGISARVATNGVLLTDERLAQLRRDTLVKSFQVSIDTLDPRLYATVHGSPPAAMESALAAVRSIQAHGFHTTVSARLTTGTLPGIVDLLDLARAEQWPTVTVHCPVHTRRVEGAPAQDADVLTMLAPVFEHFCSLPDSWLIETYIPWAPYHATVRRLQGRARFVHCGCRAGRDRVTISPSGWVSPCVCLDVPVAYVGNVREHDIADLFRSARLCDMMRRPREYGICIECAHTAQCGGGCRSAAFALTGRLDGQDRSCPVWRARSARRARADGDV